MLKAYSQRLSPPYSGLAQVVESDRARAITMDAERWEIHFLRTIANPELYKLKSFQRSFRRVANIGHSQLERILRDGRHQGDVIDERILELASFILEQELPFPVADHYEYWLLDAEDESPLAMIFSCIENEHISTFPKRDEWTALPAARMKVKVTEDETKNQLPPVNYRFECLVNQRAGQKPKARWFNRGEISNIKFPPFLVREDWSNDNDHILCQRYIERKSPRLLMLQNLTHESRLRLEQAAKTQAMEVARFYPMYPEVANKALMDTIRVEARMRALVSEVEDSFYNKHDGIYYI